MNQLDPLINKSMWTFEEDAIIKKLHNQVGTKWRKFVDYLPGRCDNAIKNRYHVISRDNFADHNRQCALKRAREIEQALSTGSNCSADHDESDDDKLKRLCSARAFLDQKIGELLAKKRRCSSPNRCSQDGSSHSTSSEKPFQVTPNAAEFELSSDFDTDWDDIDVDVFMSAFETEEPSWLVSGDNTMSELHSKRICSDMLG